MVGGLVTGAVVERLGGYVCNTYMGAKGYSMGIFNFSDETCKRIVRCSVVDDLCPAQNGTSEQADEPENITNASEDTKEQPNPSEAIQTSEVVADDLDGSPVKKASKSAQSGEKASEELIKLWREKGFSRIIPLLIAAPELDPWTLVQKLLPLLPNTAPFAIYHHYLQPLATCMHNLQIERMAVGLQLTEPWLREYQVLPARTHPCMRTNGFGGYILSGTKLCGVDPHA